MERTIAGAAHATTGELDFRASVDEPDFSLAEVWGDTVDLKHLAWSVVLGVTISVGAFEGGRAGLSFFVSDPAIARAYAMLVGLGGCLLAGIVSAVFFKPKRIVVEHTFDDASRLAMLDQLDEEGGGIGTLSDLSDSAMAELKELGLLELFASREARGATTPRGER